MRRLLLILSLPSVVTAAFGLHGVNSEQRWLNGTRELQWMNGTSELHLGRRGVLVDGSEKLVEVATKLEAILEEIKKVFKTEDGISKSPMVSMAEELSWLSFRWLYMESSLVAQHAESLLVFLRDKSSRTSIAIEEIHLTQFGQVNPASGF